MIVERLDLLLAVGVPADPWPLLESVDEDALLERALDRRLRGKAPGDLDDRNRARIVRGLMAQGFRLEAILKKLQ